MRMWTSDYHGDGDGDEFAYDWNIPGYKNVGRASRAVG